MFSRLSHLPLLATSTILSSLLFPKRIRSVCPSETKAPSNYSSTFLNSLCLFSMKLSPSVSNLTVPFPWFIFPSKTTITKIYHPTKLRFISILVWQVILLSSPQKLSALGFHSTIFFEVFSWDVTWGFSCSCRIGAAQELYQAFVGLMLSFLSFSPPRHSLPLLDSYFASIKRRQWTV